jgi:hypothetical protein
LEFSVKICYFTFLPSKGEKMSFTVLYEFHRKEAGFFHGLSLGVSHDAFSWEELGLSRPLPVGSRNGEATVKDADVRAQLSGTSLPRHIPPSPVLIFSQRAQEGNCVGGKGCRGEPDKFPLIVGFPGVEEPESLAEPSADRQGTSSWPLRPQALLRVKEQLAASPEMFSPPAPLISKSGGFESIAKRPSLSGRIGAHFWYNEVLAGGRGTGVEVALGLEADICNFTQLSSSWLRSGELQGVRFPQRRVSLMLKMTSETRIVLAELPGTHVH